MSAVDRRAALLDAAVAEIARRGTRGLRIEAVANAAGVSTALIYHHFLDRSTLLQSALEHIGARADGYTKPLVGTGRDMARAMLLSEIQDDEGVRVNSAAWGELRDSAIFDITLRPTVARLTQRWVDDTAMHICDGVADGSVGSRTDAPAVAVQLTALVEGISTRWLTDQLTTAQARAHLLEAIDALLGDEHRARHTDSMSNDETPLATTDSDITAGTAESDEELDLVSFDLNDDGKISPIEGVRQEIGLVDARLEEVAKEGGVKGKLADAAHHILDTLDND